MAFVVGYRATDKGFLYFCTAESDNPCVRGEIVLTVYSKHEYDIGDCINYKWVKLGGEYKAIERK